MILVFSCISSSVVVYCGFILLFDDYLDVLCLYPQRAVRHKAWNHVTVGFCSVEVNCLHQGSVVPNKGFILNTIKVM